MRILLSNDDGYFAPGLRHLADALGAIGEITVVAPERDRSGASNSLTLDRPLKLGQASNGFFHLNGTPTDCVHMAVTGLLDHMPDIGKCEFEAGDFQDFVGSANISDDRRSHSLTYDVPIDCVWTLRVEEAFKMYIQFNQYELKHPNDCHLNYIQVFVLFAVSRE